MSKNSKGTTIGSLSLHRIVSESKRVLTVSKIFMSVTPFSRKLRLKSKASAIIDLEYTRFYFNNTKPVSAGTVIEDVTLLLS